MRITRRVELPAGLRFYAAGMGYPSCRIRWMRILALDPGPGWRAGKLLKGGKG